MDPERELRIALESHLSQLEICTTGPLSDLSAIGTQYKRVSGSFVTDGFVVGDNIHATGFTGNANGLSRVTAVANLALTVDRTLPTVSAGGTRTIYAGVPAISYAGQPFTIPVDKQWIRARVRNAGQRVIGVGEINIQRHEGIYLLDVFGPYDSGMGLSQLERLAAAVREHFKITTSIQRPGLTVRISGMNPGSLLEDTDQLQMPVSATYWADVQGL